MNRSELILNGGGNRNEVRMSQPNAPRLAMVIGITKFRLHSLTSSQCVFPPFLMFYTVAVGGSFDSGSCTQSKEKCYP